LVQLVLCWFISCQVGKPFRHLVHLIEDPRSVWQSSMWFLRFHIREQVWVQRLHGNRRTPVSCSCVPYKYDLFV
jgi:hypothetical protein